MGPLSIAHSADDDNDRKRPAEDIATIATATPSPTKGYATATLESRVIYETKRKKSRNAMIFLSVNWPIHPLVQIRGLAIEGALCSGGRLLRALTPLFNLKRWRRAEEHRTKHRRELHRTNDLSHSSLLLSTFAKGNFFLGARLCVLRIFAVADIRGTARYEDMCKVVSQNMVAT